MASSLRTPDSPPILGRQPSYIHFTPRRAMASFENLVVLANYEERLREARKVVWRDRGERPVELQDLGECFEHACRGGIRSATLAFAIRSGVNFILLLSRIRRVPKRFRLSLIRHALFGEDSVRFAAMLGSFVGLYKLILNALPLLLPQPQTPAPSTHARERSLFRRTVRRNARPTDNPFDDAEFDDAELGLPERGRERDLRQARLSTSAQAHQVWVRKRTRRWYSALAGSLAGAIAIMLEKKSRRVGIAQQMFVRGLQGSFNANGLKIPHGDVLIFTLCCGQIMYAFLMRPDTLPPSYNRWIQVASKVPEEAPMMHKSLVREHMFDPVDMERVLRYKGITRNNYALLSDRITKARLPEDLRSFGPYYTPCAAVHPDIDSCIKVQFAHFWEVFRWMLPIYGALHFIPMMLFRRDKFLKAPTPMLLRAAWGTGRSSAFLGAFVIIYQAFFCGKHNLYEKLVAMHNSKSKSLLAKLVQRIPPWCLMVLISKPSNFVLGLLSGLSLFVEEKHRREELAMYVLPKGLESAWVMARGRGWVFTFGRYGDALLSAIGMGMVMSTYQNDPQHLSGLVRRILYQFIGPN